MLFKNLVKKVLALSAGLSVASAYYSTGRVTGDIGTHDPCMIRRKSDGKYFLFATHDMISIKTSTDRTRFTRVGQVLNSAPKWCTQAGYGGCNDPWAPDVSYHDGLYWLYYSVSTFGSQNSAIGLATSKTMEPGSWTDRGQVVNSKSNNSKTPWNAIDPAQIFDKNGNLYMAWGSWSGGIYMHQLDKKTGKLNSSADKSIQIAKGFAYEGVALYLHNNRYYLFVSAGYCCPAKNPPEFKSGTEYRIIVGRSSNIKGDYVDRSGKSLRKGGGTLVLPTHDTTWGPGGMSIFRDGNNDVLVYHYRDTRDNYVPKLGINYICWDNKDWPYVC